MLTYYSSDKSCNISKNKKTESGEGNPLPNTYHCKKKLSWQAHEQLYFQYLFVKDKEQYENSWVREKQSSKLSWK